MSARRSLPRVFKCCQRLKQSPMCTCNGRTYSSSRRMPFVVSKSSVVRRPPHVAHAWRYAIHTVHGANRASNALPALLMGADLSVLFSCTLFTSCSVWPANGDYLQSVINGMHDECHYIVNEPLEEFEESREEEPVLSAKKSRENGAFISELKGHDKKRYRVETGQSTVRLQH